MKKIAIQGIKGCFHNVSFINFFWVNGYEIIECKSFNQLSHSVTKKEAYLGIIAIENSTIGSLLSNYIFLLNHFFEILDPIFQYIKHSVIVVFYKKYNQILSHSIALQQCNNFIYENTNLESLEYNDTALSALYLSKKIIKKTAAISAKLAAKEYKLKTIYRNIQNVSNNFTLFFIIESLQTKKKENFYKTYCTFFFFFFF